MSNHYKMRIQELEESRLKLITDARELREECEKLKAQLKRIKARATKIKKQPLPGERALSGGERAPRGAEVKGAWERTEKVIPIQEFSRHFVADDSMGDPEFRMKPTVTQ